MSAQHSPLRRRLPAIVMIAIALIVVVAGLAMRFARADQLQARADAQVIPTVAVVAPSPVEGSALDLPARIEAWTRAPIYARTSGYLRTRNVDIGDPVEAGQVLATITAPDVDQALLQGRAELSSARSDAALAAATAQRWQQLQTSNLVSRQDSEERAATQRAKQAQASAQQANVDRLGAMQQYLRVTAPFDGVVTERNTDVGALISEGQTSGDALFVVSDTSKLRVYVTVPQQQLASVRVGGQATLVVPEQPDHPYPATVQSLARAIDASSGGMRVQLSVDNKDGALLPGGFATVRFDPPKDAARVALGVPPSALIIGKDGVRIAVLGTGDTIRLRDVRIASDHGDVVELTGGLAATDRVVTNPPDGVQDGTKVHLAQ